MASVGADYTVQSMADHKMIRLYEANIKWKRVIIKRPLIVTDKQMESLKIICASKAKDIVLITSDVHKFKAGQDGTNN